MMIVILKRRASFLKKPDMSKMVESIFMAKKIPHATTSVQ